MDEILEFVDDANQVIGKATRDEVHRKGLQHRSTHVFLFNSRGEIYLQKRSLNKSEHPGYFDSSAAGHLQPDETYGACAMRELKEELGIEAPLLIPLGVQKTPDQRSVEHAMLYLCRSDEPPQPDPEEVESGTFYPLVKIDSWIEQGGRELTPAFMILFQTYRGQIEDWSKER
jgi:isopentenyldiphosphate isomerase